MPPRFLVFTAGLLTEEDAKTGVSAIRYLPGRVAAVIDLPLAGTTVDEALGFGGAIPIVADLAAGLEHEPEALLIGVAPAGGRLPETWQRLCVQAAQHGLELWSGLHESLAAVPAIAAAADRSGVAIHELRRVPEELRVATGAAAAVSACVVLTVGSDCAVGKLTTAMELVRGLEDEGVKASLVPTGQTGILLAGWGIAVDAVKSDFVAGAAEALVLEAARHGSDVLVVEGQGALTHPGYSGVTLGLLHGATPRGMILCHEAGRRRHSGSEYDWTELPGLGELLELYETAAAWVRPARVVGVALDTHRLAPQQAAAAVEAAALSTGLPATDPVRFGAAPLVAAVKELISS
jgi:uncharacterized NAD-dependent epimerase/dehydratase family protein